MAVITEAHIRSAYRKAKFTSYSVNPGDKITPAARDFLLDRKIEIVEDGQEGKKSDTRKHKHLKLVETAPEPRPEPEFVCDATGGTYHRKPVHMTVLDDNRLVQKWDRRIVLQGQLDLFQADILMAQIECLKEGSNELYALLQKVLTGVRAIFMAWFTGKPIPPEDVTGMSTEELQKALKALHKNKNLQLIDASMGKIAVTMNWLRTRSRELEIAAINCCRRGGGVEREDIIQAINDLSDLIYLLQVQAQTSEKK